MVEKKKILKNNPHPFVQDFITLTRFSQPYISMSVYRNALAMRYLNEMFSFLTSLKIRTL